jgi:hypothetical protein
MNPAILAFQLALMAAPVPHNAINIQQEAKLPPQRQHPQNPQKLGKSRHNSQQSMRNRPLHQPQSRGRK